MTKSVRIENSDMNLSQAILVHTYQKSLDGSEDKLLQTQTLYNPCDMTSGIYITNDTYIKIEELALKE